LDFFQDKDVTVCVHSSQEWPVLPHLLFNLNEPLPFPRSRGVRRGKIYSNPVSSIVGLDMESHFVYRDVHYELSFRKLWGVLNDLEEKKVIKAGPCRRING
jgi:hypothetical protein